MVHQLVRRPGWVGWPGWGPGCQGRGRRRGWGCVRCARAGQLGQARRQDCFNYDFPKRQCDLSHRLSRTLPLPSLLVAAFFLSVAAPQHSPLLPTLPHQSDQPAATATAMLVRGSATLLRRTHAINLHCRFQSYKLKGQSSTLWEVIIFPSNWRFKTFCATNALPGALHISSNFEPLSQIFTLFW